MGTPASAGTASFATSAVRTPVCASSHCTRACWCSITSTRLSLAGTGCGVIPCEQCAAFGSVATRVRPSVLSPNQGSHVLLPVEEAARGVSRETGRAVPGLHQALLQ